MNTALLCLAVAIISIYHVVESSPSRQESTDELVEKLIGKLEKQAQKEDHHYKEQVDELKTLLDHKKADGGLKTMTNKDFDTCPGGNIGSFPPQGAMFYPAILNQDQMPKTKRHAVTKNHDGDGAHHEGDEDHTEEEEDHTEEEEEGEDRAFVGKRLHHHKRGSKKSKRSAHHAKDGDEHHDGDEHSEEDDDHTEALPAVAPLMTSRCSHVITVTKPRVYMIASTVNVEGLSDCSTSQLNLYEGSDAKSGKPFLQLCGSTVPHIIKSKGNTVFVDYVTADTASGDGNGFMLTWIAGH